MQEKITINDALKADVKKVRVVMDVYDESGETPISQGQFVDLDESQLDSIGAANIQGLANSYYGIEQPQGE